MPNDPRPLDRPTPSSPEVPASADVRGSAEVQQGGGAPGSGDLPAADRPEAGEVRDRVDSVVDAHGRAGEHPDVVSAADMDDEVPDESELVRIARPATVRRAPKFSAFLVVGGLVGLLVGLVLVAVVNPGRPVTAGETGVIPFVDRRGMLRLTMAGGGMLVGVLVGGALAILADRRSVRRARGPVRP